jgi:hypothetical protein
MRTQYDNFSAARPMPEAAFTVPIYVPFVGCLLCVGLLVADIVG